MIRKGTASKKLNPRAGVVVTPPRLSSSFTSSESRRRLGKRLCAWSHSLSLSLDGGGVLFQSARNFKRFFFVGLTSADEFKDLF